MSFFKDIIKKVTDQGMKKTTETRKHVKGLN